ncbi:hypothetical protein KSP39_PZI001076 [Platanthera zijinensis]|uniref:Uncharacterized protein n=1 Tax=Platanthera zijinensis TaxID=2320716 RepID=A0AAP0C0G8_9ASPA
MSDESKPLAEILGKIVFISRSLPHLLLQAFSFSRRKKSEDFRSEVKVSVPVDLNAVVRRNVTEAIWQSGSNSPFTASDSSGLYPPPISASPFNLQRLPASSSTTTSSRSTSPPEIPDRASPRLDEL